MNEVLYGQILYFTVLVLTNEGKRISKFVFRLILHLEENQLFCHRGQPRK